MSHQPISIPSHTSQSLANLVIIGAMKCGTSSLHQYLGMHPQIQMAAEKELDFFIEEKNWQKGLDWYRSHFDASIQIRGEASPNYTKYHAFQGVPQRMYQIIPNAKLIYLVRDPIKRIVSHYLHNVIDRCESRSLTEALQDLEINHYVKCSLYYQQLQKFLVYYPLEQILVVSLETLACDRQATLRKIFQFLEIESDFEHGEFSRVFHQSKQKKRLTDLGQWITQLPMAGRLRQVFPSLLEESTEAPILHQGLQESLIKFLREDVESLKALTHCSFSDWNL
jgi:hypothetical protein